MNPVRWFGIIVLFTALTMLTVYFVPADSPVSVVRFVLGFVYVLFAPGYCLVNVLFTGENRLDVVEKSVLSVALSFGVTGITGLFLGLSPIGLLFTPITVSISGITLVLAAIAFVRKRMEAQKPEVQAAAQTNPTEENLTVV